MAGKILVPVDFSTHTRITCEYALNLAMLTRKELILFHSFYDQIYFSDGGFATGFESGIMLTDEIILDFYKQKEARLLSIMEDLRMEAADGGEPDLSITCQIESGDPEVMILNAINRIEPQLIVMGSSGMGRKSIFAGSVARRIMDHTTIPVIAVPELEKLPGISSVTYMTNFDPSDPLVITEIDSIFSPLSIQIQCVHISSGKNEVIARENLDNLTNKDLPVRPGTSLSYHVITGDNAQETLEAFIEDNQTDLIAFIPHKRNIFKNFNRQNLRKEDLFLTRTPIMAIPSRY